MSDTSLSLSYTRAAGGARARAGSAPRAGRHALLAALALAAHLALTASMETEMEMDEYSYSGAKEKGMKAVTALRFTKSRMRPGRATAAA